MEFINRIELQGVVGAVREIPVGDSKVVRFSVCTEYVYRHKDGASVVDCVWHSVTGYPPSGESWDWLTKGARVRVEGRIRNSRYTASDGTERTMSEVVASSVKPMGEA